MLVEIFKKSDRIHTFPESATSQQRDEFTHQPHHAMVTDTEYSDSQNQENMFLPPIYLDYSNNE